MEMPSKRQDTAENPPSLNISHTQPTSDDGNRSSHPDPPDTLPLLPTLSTADDTKPKPAFLSLPGEIRTMIYDHLLVRRCGPNKVNPRASFEPGWISVKCPFHEPGSRRVSILRTCKTIHNEATPILYSRNKFQVFQLDLSRFLEQIGPRNIKLLRTLDVWVYWEDSFTSWVKILKIFTEEANLEHLRFGWGSEWEFGRPSCQKGLGNDPRFARALARIPGLETLNLAGYYASDWPAYMKRESSARVHAKRSDCVKPLVGIDDFLKDYDSSEDEELQWHENNERWLRETFELST